MKYLKEFTNKSDYDAAYASGELPFPHVCKVGEEVIYASEFESELDANLPFYIEALEDLTVSFSTNTIQYSLDKVTWNDLAPGTDTPTVTSGSKIYFKAYKLTATESVGIGTFNISGQCNLGGNIASLYLGLDFDKYLKNVCSLPNYYFLKLFYNQQMIINADKLIISFRYLNNQSLRQMFENCSSLINAPIVYCESVPEGSFSKMFYNCTSLVNASQIDLGNIMYNYRQSFYQMFYNCTSLVNAPSIIKIITIYENLCFQMFYNCISLVNAPKIIGPDDSSSNSTSAFNMMFCNCKSLVNVPDLNFKMTIYSAKQMFYNCTSLVNAPKIYYLGTSSSSNMTSPFTGCSSLENVSFTITPYKSSNTSTGYVYFYNMFNDCPSLRNVTIISDSNNSAEIRHLTDNTINVTLHKDPSLTVVGSFVVENWNIVDNVYEEV